MADPDAGEGHFLEYLNPQSLIKVTGCKVESDLALAVPGDYYQFEREGYFTRDICSDDELVFNCTIGLRDSWKA